MADSDGGRCNAKRPTLLFVNQHYWPDVASTGQHLTDLAEHLAAENYEVEVLTGRATYVASAGAAPTREKRNGVTIRRARTTRFGRSSHVGRLADYITFYVRVAAEMLGRPRRSLVIFLTTPPLMMVLGALAKLFRRQPYAVWSMDLHPDAEIAAGMVKEGSLTANLLLWLMAVGYRHAEFVVDLGPFMKARLLAKGVNSDRLHTIPVWSRDGEIEPTPAARNPLRRDLGLDEQFVVMYSGNAGLVHDFGAILEAMRELKDTPSVYWLFVGDGPRRKEIEDFVRREGVQNFQYRSYFPREMLRYSLAVGDVHLVTLRPAFAGIAVPGKLYGIMAAGRPVLFLGPGNCESAVTVAQANCGVVIDSADASRTAKLVESIAQLAFDRRLRDSLGVAARACFEQHYEQTPNVRRFGQLLASVLR